MDLDLYLDEPKLAEILVVDEHGKTQPLAELLAPFKRDGEIWGTRDRSGDGEAIDYVGPAERVRLFRVVDRGPERIAPRMLARREEITAAAVTPVRRIT